MAVLMQCLYNLMGNAMKFTTQGTITVKIKPVSGTMLGLEMVQISIQDTGCGIPKEKHRTIFEAFGQVTRLIGVVNDSTVELIGLIKSHAFETAQLLAASNLTSACLQTSARVLMTRERQYAK